jgi:hypothetical protein
MFISDELVARLRRSSIAVALVAIDAVQTPEGAVRVFHAERLGLNRRSVTRSAERRIAQLRREMPDTQRNQVVAAGEPRIVSAVGYGRLRQDIFH